MNNARNLYLTHSSITLTRNMYQKRKKRRFRRMHRYFNVTKTITSLNLMGSVKGVIDTIQIENKVVFLKIVRTQFIWDFKFF